MTLCVLSEPSIPHRIEILREDGEAQLGHATIPSGELVVDELRVAILGESVLSVWVFAEPPLTNETGTIERFDEDGYRIRRAIPYEIEQLQPNDFVARFAEANISIGGVDAQDAYQSLVAEILDTLDTLIVEDQLSPAAADQLRILQTYLVKA